jgi:predicted ATPase
MAFLDKQCIIETHSEYFIDKLRLRVCESLLKYKSPVFKDRTKIYFFDKEEDVTKAMELEINKYGALSRLPKGFLDEERGIISDRLFDMIISEKYIEADPEEDDD